MGPTFTSQHVTTRCPVSELLREVMIGEVRLAVRIGAYVSSVRGSPLQSLERLLAGQRRHIEAWLSEVRDRAGDFGIAGDAVCPPPAPPTDGMPRHNAIGELVALHETLAAELQKVVDARADLACDIAALLKRLLEFHETSAWMLRLLLDTAEPSKME